MQQFTEILSRASAAIGKEYFLLPISGTSSVYRERVYCYELYHQMRPLWLSDSLYRLNGEIDKSAHPYFRKSRKQPKPDFLVHEPGTNNNYAVIEVKSAPGASSSGICKDLQTLSDFKNLGYQRAIYLIYGAGGAPADAIDGARVKRLELWLHPGAGKPAFRQSL